jgi:hypothetical protein
MGKLRIPSEGEKAREKICPPVKFTLLSSEMSSALVLSFKTYLRLPHHTILTYIVTSP